MAARLVFAPQRSNAFRIILLVSIGAIVVVSARGSRPAARVVVTLKKLANPAFAHASIAKIGVST
jgi:hypothetical protein